MFSSQHNGQHVYKILTIMEVLLDKVSETKQHCQNVELRGRGSWVLIFFFFLSVGMRFHVNLYLKLSETLENTQPQFREWMEGRKLSHGVGGHEIVGFP